MARIADDQLAVSIARSPDQRAHEEQLREVGEALLAIEGAIRRVKQARAALRPNTTDGNLLLALDRAATELESVRRRLHQDTYLVSVQQAMF